MQTLKVKNFERVTFSFPPKIIEQLRIKVPKNQMSKYVVKLIKDDLEKRMEQDNDKFAMEMAELRKRLAKNQRTNEESLTILRKIRYGEE